MSKRKFGTRQQWLAGSAGLATAFVAVTAFRLAYAGSKGAATDAGLPSTDAAWYPLCIEGVLVVAAIGTVVLSGWYPWTVLVLFSGLSIGANMQHAVDADGAANWFNLLVAAVPPAALPLCVELTVRTVRKLAATSGSVAAPGQGGGSLDTNPASLPGKPATSLRPGSGVATGQDGSPPVPVARPVPAPDDRTGGHAEPSVRSLTHAEDTLREDTEHKDTTGRQVYLAAVPEDTEDTFPGVPARTPRGHRVRAAGTPRPHRVVVPVGVPEDADLVSRLRVLREDSEDTLTTVRPVAKALHIGKERARRVLELDATTPRTGGEQ